MSNEQAPSGELSDEQLRDALRQCPHDTVENLRVRWLYAKDFARACIAADRALRTRKLSDAVTAWQNLPVTANAEAVASALHGAIPGVNAGWLDKAMEQAQVFASSWSLVGGRFASENQHDEAMTEKAELREMLEGAQAALAVQAAEIARLTAERDGLNRKNMAMAEALRDIQHTGPLDNVLDPQRPARVAAAAIAKEAGK